MIKRDEMETHFILYYKEFYTKSKTILAIPFAA